MLQVQGAVVRGIQQYSGRVGEEEEKGKGRVSPAGWMKCGAGIGNFSCQARFEDEMSLPWYRSEMRFSSIVGPSRTMTPADGKNRWQP